MGSSGAAASPGLRLPAGSGGEQVEDGGSEGKDKATCVAASDVKEEEEEEKMPLHAPAPAPLFQRSARKDG